MTAQPPTAETSDRRESKWNPREIADLLDVQPAHITQIFRQPKDVEVPCGVGEKFCGHEAPDLAVGKKPQPRNRLRLTSRGVARGRNIFAFRGRDKAISG